MAVTATKVETIADAMNTGDPAAVASAAEEAKLGTMMSPQQYTIVALASTAAVDLTSAAVAAAVTPVLAAGVRLPAALCAGVIAVRVTAGAAAAGPRIVTDAGGTASATVAKLSADGKTLTFEAGVTAFVLEYMARSSVSMAAPFATV